ncbi:hypothetical protein PIIN_07673 [Serendipita indica DSM 11827]|uniref:NAD-dependent epimerase/dehydratase domain-containing protein n=1 Tax=Serendipita indica (strain DSM 11827) TaxID=1109443 RepID=G4TQX5_SERID|nr:hypothetical protein PIIN_07673 [Serendipita indica DSM 11827]
MSAKPNAIIFGALHSFTPVLVCSLFPEGKEPLVAHVRIVDKYSIHPPTTYLIKSFRNLLESKKGVIEYRQANLTVPAVVQKCVEDPAPDGRPYTYVFDNSGNFYYNLPSEVHVEQSLKPSLNIAQAVAATNAANPSTVKAYVRGLPPFYNHKDPPEKYKEGDDRAWKPLGNRGIWWHESVRAIGNIKDLPLVVLRAGYYYGEGLVYSECTSAIALGAVYKELKTEMKLYWSRNLRKNTIHIEDLARAHWMAAEWIASTGRNNANALIGVPIPPSQSPLVTPANTSTLSTPLPPPTESITVPVFNVVDGSDTTQGAISDAISAYFGIQAVWLDERLTELSGAKLQKFTEDVNDVHVGAWDAMVREATPRIKETPISPYTEAHQVEEHGCSLDGSKIRDVLGFKPTRGKFDEQAVRLYVEWCRAEGVWP